MVNVRWQHGVNFIAGGWLFASPWFLDYLYQPITAAANALIAGTAILLCSLLALQFEDMEKVPRATLILGMWTFLAPWILRFSEPTLLAANSMGVGFLVLIMSAWMLSEETSLLHRRSNRRGHA